MRGALRRRLVATALAVGILAAPALGRAEEGCAGFAWPVTREQAWFAASPALVAEGSTLAVGAASVELRPQSEIAFTVPPERPAKEASPRGAVLRLSLPAGLYQITLSDNAWIDVVQDGTRLAAAGFSGRTDCPGVRKSVRFRLAERPAVLQLSGVAVERMLVAVAPAEEARAP